MNSNSLKYLLGALLVTGCASTKAESHTPAVTDALASSPPQPESKPVSVEPAGNPSMPSVKSEQVGEPSPAGPPDIAFREVPGVGVGASSGEDVEEPMPTVRRQTLNVTIASKTVPDFINTVFGELLEVGFVIGPGVQERQDKVALRSVNNIDSRDLFEVAMNALKDYGIGAYSKDGVLHFVEYEELKRAMPRYVRARARDHVPQTLRPVVQYVQLISANAQDVANQLADVFPDKNVITIKPNQGTNSLTLSGLPDEVDRALSIVDVLDVPQYAGSRVATFRPENWKAPDLVKQLNDLLTVEGFSVSTTAAVSRNINLISIANTNQVSIFAKDEVSLQHALDSALRLDRDARPISTVKSAHVYKTKFYNAEELASVLDQVLAAGSVSDGASLSPVATVAQPLVAAEGSFNTGSEIAVPRLSSGRIVVEKQGNRLIYFGTDEEFQGLLQLLERIDTPADEVLLEVTIAEVSLNDETRSGLEFLFEQLGSKGYAVSAGTSGGLGLATGGFLGSLTSGEFLVDFGALATNSQVNVLSEPRIVTKSGAKASINVGQEVPTISSQRAAPTQVGGSTDVLQSIQYRETGIILDIEPTVFSDYRIDLKISQEVSAAEPNENQAIGSPIISNRSLVTELSLTDSSTVLLGGLIENRFTRGQTGVPLLKDIPWLGRAFRTETLTSSQTVLLVMITPYILTDQSDRQRPLENFRDHANFAMRRNLNERATTLLKPRDDMEIPEIKTLEGYQ